MADSKCWRGRAARLYARTPPVRLSSDGDRPGGAKARSTVTIPPDALDRIAGIASDDLP